MNASNGHAEENLMVEQAADRRMDGGKSDWVCDFGFDRFTDCSLDSYSHGSLGMYFRNRISFDA